MKKILLILVFSFVSVSIAFSQEKDSLFKKYSIGANYMLNLETRFSREMHYQHFFGLSFDYHIYKGLFVSTGIEFSKRYFEEEWTGYAPYGPIIYVNYEYTEYWFKTPLNIKYYFVKNSSKMLHPFITAGFYNNLKYKKGYDKAEENNIDEKLFVFNFFIAGGAEIKIINNMGFSLELLYNIPQYYNYNLKKSDVVPYNFGIKGTVSYLF